MNEDILSEKDTFEPHNWAGGVLLKFLAAGMQRAVLF